MFVKFQSPPAEPSLAEVRGTEAAMTAAELQGAATARGIDLTKQEPSHARCKHCQHFRFRSLDPTDLSDRCCTKAVPLITEDGRGVWPRVSGEDTCGSYLESHSGDRERRRLLQVYHAKLVAEQAAAAALQAEADKVKDMKRRAKR